MTKCKGPHHDFDDFLHDFYDFTTFPTTVTRQNRLAHGAKMGPASGGTAQYEQTQETQRKRDFERDLAFYLAFSFSYYVLLSSPNSFSVTPQSHYTHM
mmetsp:Transcript_23222/g.37239  ORF Transcript_23222/g.37239 Transcript_23222/m.37239 type:complete len:98 (+) Transcript_23222:2543-2836(+)